MFMVLIFFMNKTVKQKLLENKRNMLKVRSIERNELAVGHTRNVMEILT